MYWPRFLFSAAFLEKKCQKLAFRGGTEQSPISSPNPITISSKKLSGTALFAAFFRTVLIRLKAIIMRLTSGIMSKTRNF